MTADLGNFSQLSGDKLPENSDFPYRRTVMTVTIESTESNVMHQPDRLENILAKVLEQCPTPQQSESVTLTLSISEFKFTIDRRRDGEPTVGEHV